MLLLTDGSVMVQQFYNTGWYHLQPDQQGHYANGKWSTNASMTAARLFYGSQVLPDGNVFVAGGEYSSPAGSGATAELFNPLANNGVGSWTNITPPASPQLLGAFSDSSSILLSNGAVAVAPVAVYDQNITNYYNTLLYYPASNYWTHVNYGSINYQDESTWLKLPDNTVLSADIFTGGTTSERFLTGPEIWIADGGLPIPMEGGSNETGGAFMMANGQAFFLGGGGHTAFYTPTGTTNRGTWTKGPDMPFFNGTIYNYNGSNYIGSAYANLLMAQDAPAAMMNNGKILCQFAPGTNHTEVWFYEYDPAVTNFVAAPCPTNATPGTPFLMSYESRISDDCSMLDLPDGNVLYNDAGNLSIYTPDGSPLAAGRPAVQNVSWNSDGSLHLAGTLFNGISQGASYGDDAQQDSNYPLVRFTDGNGIVTYGRTYNWSSTGVQTGNQIVTTECTVPTNILANAGAFYSLQVVANGNASAAISFASPVWVDFDYTNPSNVYLGTYPDPYDTLASGVSAVPSGATIAINAFVQPSTSTETMRISKPMKIISVAGPSTIGHQ